MINILIKAIFVFVFFVQHAVAVVSLDDAFDAYNREDYVEAENMFRDLYLRGNVYAQLMLSEMLMTGMGVEKDESKAVQLIMAAASSGNLIAQERMGYVYENGIVRSKNIDKAIDYYYKSANQGYSKAAKRLAIIFEDGVGVEVDESESRFWFLKAAEYGDSYSQYRVGLWYEFGEGVDKDVSMARLYYRKASDSMSDAKYRLGLSYVDADNPKSDDSKKAFSLISDAARSGNDRAIAYIGYMYDEGIGVEENDKIAVEWYQKGADLGFTGAQTNLGLMYYYGHGVEENNLMAVYYFEKAANKNGSRAKFMLGKAYSGGYGVERDLIESYKWYKLALIDGFDGAQKEINKLRSYMSGRQIRLADKIVNDLVGGDDKKNIQDGRVDYDSKDAGFDGGLSGRWNVSQEMRGDFVSNCLKGIDEDNSALKGDQWNIYCGCMIDNAHEYFDSFSEYMKVLLEEDVEVIGSFAMKCISYSLSPEQGFDVGSGNKDISLDKMVHEFVDMMNARTPIQLDVATRLDRVKYNPSDKVVSIIHTVTDDSIASIFTSYDGDLSDLIGGIIKDECENKFTKKLIAKDVSFRYIYKNNRSKVIASELLKCSGDSGGILKSSNELKFTGTGFFINSNTVATNNHVVESCAKITVGRGAKEVAVTKILYDEKIDIALLDSSVIGSDDYLSFRSGRGIRSGDSIVVVGYPLGDALGASHKVTNGNVSSLSGMQGSFDRMQITAPVQSGNSGGPVLDLSGNVVGMVVAKMGKRAERVFDESLQNINFAIKNNTLLSYFDANDIEYSLDTYKYDMSASDVVENSKDSIVTVNCFD